MNKYDDKDWGIEIQRCDDGDLLLRQGLCGCGDDVAIRLHPCHFSLMAGYPDCMTQSEFDNATTRAHDRLQLLVGLIESHLSPEHPLTRATAVLLGSTTKQPKQKQIDPVKDDKQFSLIEE